MKITGFGYLIREGLKNVWNNRLMSIASICVLMSCLVLTGSAVLMSMNVDLMVKKAIAQNETRVFLVSILLSIEKVTLEIILFFCENKSEETKNRIRQIGKIIVILCCTILPRYHYDTIYDIIISISIIIL